MTPNEKMAELARLTKIAIANDPMIRRWRVSIKKREDVVKRRVAKEFRSMLRSQFLQELGRRGVPVLPSETNRWNERERHEAIKGK